MYGKSRYGMQPYASEGENSGVKEEVYKDLTKLVPEFIASKIEMQELYKTQGYEVGGLNYALVDVINQCFLATATWGLSRWEQVFCIPVNMALSYEQRREILMAKIRGNGTTTKEMIKEAAVAFSGGDVEIIEENQHSLFIVRFIGIKGIPRNMHGFISMLEEIKPAHLAYTFEYRYTEWNEMSTYIWSSLQTINWNEVRILKEGK